MFSPDSHVQHMHVHTWDSLFAFLFEANKALLSPSSSPRVLDQPVIISFLLDPLPLATLVNTSIASKSSMLEPIPGPTFLFHIFAVCRPVWRPIAHVLSLLDWRAWFFADNNDSMFPISSPRAVITRWKYTAWVITPATIACSNSNGQRSAL